MCCFDRIFWANQIILLIIINTWNLDFLGYSQIMVET